MSVPRARSQRAAKKSRLSQPAIGATVPCGHCFHVSCFDHWTATNISQNLETKCPTCTIPTSLFIQLQHQTLQENRCRGTESVELSRACIAACVPCGHYFHGRDWNEWVTDSLFNEDQLLGATTQHTPAKCPSCARTVGGVLRLFANLPTSQQTCMLNHLGGAPAVPKRLLVTGAGIDVVNGMYVTNGSCQGGANRYVRRALWNNMVCDLTIFPSTTKSNQDCWFISLVLDSSNEGKDTDIDFYHAPRTESYRTTPPLTGWIGKSPPYPSLVYLWNDPREDASDDDGASGEEDRADDASSIWDQRLSNSFADMYDSEDVDSDDAASSSIFTRIVVEGAGNPVVNGTYEENGLFEGAKQFVRDGTWNHTRCLFYIFLCKVSRTTKRWYISIVPLGAIPGTSSDIDFYTAPMVAASMTAPPRQGWAKTGKGKDPSPLLIHRDLEDDILRSEERVGNGMNAEQDRADDASSSSICTPSISNSVADVYDFEDIDSYVHDTDDATSSGIFTRIVVEGAGNPVVNGTYEENGLFEGAKQFVRDGTWNDTRCLFYIFLCKVSRTTKRWYISIVPRGAIPGTSSDIDFYTAPMAAASMTAPPRQGWAKTGKGKDPSPLLIHCDLVDDMWVNEERVGNGMNHDNGSLQFRRGNVRF